MWEYKHICIDFCRCFSYFKHFAFDIKSVDLLVEEAEDNRKAVFFSFFLLSFMIFIVFQ